MKKAYSIFAAFLLLSSFAFAQVTQQWVATYDGGGNDYNNIMVMDASGNTYVTGTSQNATVDFVTVKYNSSGVQQWTASFNGAGNSADTPAAIAVDASGNVYVTGSSYNGSNRDYATVKYDNTGAEQWSAIFNGAANLNDDAYAIAVDGSGNVYVTGGSFSAVSRDYVTVKYNSGGAQQWATSFDGAANNTDIGYKIGVDALGNCYVTGNSNNGTDYDFATIKYDNAGTQQWAIVYNGLGGFDDYIREMLVDASGDIFVSGGVYNGASNQDFVTIKYNSAGVQQFIATYSETPTSDEVEYAMTLDASGNIYMTGFTNDGVSSSLTTVKFNSSGVQQWSTLYAGPGGTDYPTAITTDASGNVYITGVTAVPLENYNYITIKYNSAGAQQWLQTYNGTANSDDNTTSIAVDASGNVYVAGFATNGGYDYATIQYVQSPPLAATQSQTDLTCNAACDGTASVVASDGVAPYTYAWSPSGGNAATATGLCAGNYTCTITDATAAFIDVLFTITEPTALTSTDSQTNLTCNANASGTATVSVSGGTGAYTYDWTPGTPTGDGTNSISGLAAGNYTCTITDANSCTLTETFTITQPAVLDGVRTRTNVSCFGGSNGTATVVATGGTPGYTYVWTPLGGNAATATGLPAGAYTVTITDANGCSVAKNYLITQPAPINCTPSQSDVSCNGGTDGSAAVGAFGGVGPYTYLWTPTGGTASFETGLTSGNYTCTITDANGCTFDQLFFIAEPAVLSDAASQTDVLCNGNSNGSITVNISGGTAAYTYSWAPNGETTATISSLAPGSYTCTTTDANSCVLTETFTITEPTALSATTSQTDNSCNGGSSGSASVVVSGGTPAYSYAWTPTGGTAATASSLAAGNYTCTITDANSCVLTETFNITEPAGMTASSSQTDVLCNGGSTGSASVVVSGGTPGYSYAWTPSGGTAATASSLAAGNYTCTITDASACSFAVTFTITEPTPLSATSMQTDVACNGGNNGDAMVMVSGGTPGYSYVWSPSGGSAAMATGLSAGNYTCTVTDANSCTLTETFSLTAPTPLSSSNMQTNISCSGGNNGDAMVMVSGGTGAYTYSWSPSGGSAAMATGLSAGNYTCTITDANSCTLTETFLLTAPAPLVSSNMQTNISCNGASNGDAMVMVSGGTGAYTYAWSPTGGFAAMATGLSAGNYTCTITDANSCSLTETFTITEPAAIAVTSSQTNVTCGGNADGAATVIVSGGTPAYSYAWSPSGGTAATASGLTAGNYTCTITDANACTSTATFNITEPVTISVTTSQTNNSCSGGTNGTATVGVSGGTPAYTYAWSPSGGTAAMASGLAAGNYTCTITDANGCSANATVTITEPSAITATTSQTNISCNGNANGSASVFPSGGTPAYTYFWLPSGGTSSTAASLSTGTYSCTITDANSCAITVTVNITEPATLTAASSQTDITCNGASNGSATVVVSGGTPSYTYAWSPSGGFAATASGLGVGTYTCSITDANSCTTTATFNITEPAPLVSSNSQTNVLCNGSATGTATVLVSGGAAAYTYIWSPSGGSAATATGLAAGNYTCDIIDANSCLLTETFVLTEPAAFVVTSSQTNATCQGNTDGSATVIVSGGTPAYSYSWSPSGGTAATASSLAAGNYTCTITDANGCTTTATFNITAPVTISVTTSQTNISCNGGTNGTATVVASGGTPAYTYAWAPTGGTAATASSLTTGNYTCTITDANGCSATATVTITEPSAITATTSQTNVSCNGSSNGSASVFPSGGTPGYSYLWAPSGGTFSTATSLSTGTYSCTITDANSCAITVTVNITEPSAMTVVSSQTNISCNGGSNGSATVAVSGGTPAYLYAWTPSGGFGATATGLAAGNYTCTITDANSCSTTATFNITQPSAITATTSQTNVSCFGGNNGTATVVAAGGTPSYTYAWTPSGGTAATASGLTAGNYTCTITDANGCTLTKTFSITQSTAVTSANSQINVSCNGGSNGTATVVASGGTPSYTYTWAPTGGTAATASGLAAGTYTCTITDANGCTGTATFSITQPPAIIFTSSQTNVSCNAGNNGSATVAPSGGSPGYTYVWAPSGGFTATATGLVAGTYTCTITDANSCTTTATFNITQPSAITATISQTNVSCFGGNNGTATVVVAGGTPSYTYAWAPTGGIAATASGLTAGNYTCTITDANGCTLTKSVTITQPPVITATTSQTNISCNGGSNGSATVVAAGGTPSYTYAWAPTGGTAATASGLSAGTYTCTITDANGCTLTKTFNITQPAVITSANSQTNVSCNAGNNGTATVVASGGTPSYTYAWAPSGGTAATASGLAAGNYTCTITDANGCTGTATFSITQPSAITFTSSQTNVTCNAGNNGSATVVVSGGTPSYTYAWAPTGGTAAIASGLTAGNYTCTITDANLCTSTATFTITQPSAITATASQTNVSCFGGTNGTATVVASGGIPSYTYAWTPTGGTAATATGLSMGTYTCTITDANGCTLAQTVTITEPAVLSATTSIMDATCFGSSNGQATVIVSGGTTAYSYAWTPTGGNAATATGLAAGSYTCTVTDANGCTLSQSAAITEPTEITISASQTDVACFNGADGDVSVSASGGTPGYTYLWTPGGATTASVNGLTAGGYTCTVTDLNGCTLDQAFNITEPTPVIVTATHTNIICQGGGNGTAHVSTSGGTPGYSFLWSPTGGTDSTATGLSAGSYICTVTDANGCTATATVSIVEPPPFFIGTSHTNVTCSSSTNGTASVTVSGGVAPYTYAWSPAGGTASTATGLAAGTYTCVITDAGGCSTSRTITIASPPALTATTTQTNVSCNGGSNGTATITVNGGSPFYSYSWMPSGGTSPIATGLSMGTYTCNVTDANGCTMSQTVLITEPLVLSATVSSTNTNCGQSNGTATIIAAGGTAPYAYSWSPTGGNAATANAILAGTYTCTVTDAHGCSGSYTVVVNDTPAPTLALVSQTNILCNGNNTGDATVLATGGAGTYTYLWTPVGGTSATANTLLAGTYTCTVTDSAGCTGTQSVTITEPTLLIANATSGMILCNGGSTTVTVIANGGVGPYTGEGTFTDTAGTYSYIVTDANGCSATAGITVTEPTILSVSITATSIMCNGGNATVTVNAAGGTSPYTGTGTFTEVAGTYTYMVTDTNGCSATDSITIAEPTLFTAASSATSILCNGGNATVSVIASGGTSPYSGEGTFTETAGTYAYIVTDANGCADTTNISVTEPTLLVSVVDSIINPTGCSATDGMIYISVSGGTSGYTYLWTNTDTNEDLAGVAAGSYTCTITDANGCTTTVDTLLTDPAPPVVTVSIDTTICAADAPYVLTEGNPIGGTWSGTSISGNTFDPSVGVGSYVLTYTYTAPNGCTGTGSDTMLVDACSGIIENTVASWSAYPNPTYGNVTLVTNGNENEDHLVEVYAADGKLVISESFTAGAQIQLNIAEQAGGIYMVRIISSSQISTVRIIKQ
jgi:hypothetical protein